MFIIEKVNEYSMVYTMGSLGYSIIEIIWRGFTHWSMAITGGICFLCLYLLNIRFVHWKLWKKCLLGCSIITGIEFIVGYIVNRIMQLNVWDYSQRLFNVLGQICPLYTLLWFLLCIPVFSLCNYLNRYLNRKKDRIQF